MKHCPNNKVCVEEQQTGLTVQWCEFDTAVTSVVACVFVCVCAHVGDRG